MTRSNATPETDAADAESTGTSALFESLADRRRRELLRCLRRRDRGVALADLAKSVAAGESERGIEDVPPQELRRVHIRLHHVHVPMLADAGLVEVDSETRTVSLTAEGQAIGERLEASRNETQPVRQSA